MIKAVLYQKQSANKFNKPDKESSHSYLSGLVGGLCGSLIAITAFAPAQWLTQYLQDASGNQLIFENSKGTIWNGSAKLLLNSGAQTRNAVALPGRFAWNVGLSALSAKIQLNSDCCLQSPVQLSLIPRKSGIEIGISDSTSQWPAQSLIGLGSPWNSIHLNGQLTLVTKGLSFTVANNKLKMSGQAHLDALNITTRLSTLSPMGSYRISFFDMNFIALKVDTIDGDLLLTGAGRFEHNKFKFRGECSANPVHADALSNFMNIIGERRGNKSLIKIG